MSIFRDDLHDDEGEQGAEGERPRGCRVPDGREDRQPDEHADHDHDPARQVGERVVAERKVVELAEMRYQGGVADYLEVLDAQRSLFAAELDETSSMRDEAVALIELYRALGGGWPQAPEGDAPAQEPAGPGGA